VEWSGVEWSGVEGSGAKRSEAKPQNWERKLEKTLKDDSQNLHVVTPKRH